MKKRLIIPFFTLIFLSSCINTTLERTFNAEKVIKIDYKSIDKKNIEHSSLYVKEVQYIPLETNDNCIIGEITKIILSSNYIYIYDWNTNNLYQFDHAGKYVKNISSKGEGPHEYMKISSFTVHPETENITIYCEIKQSILEFTSEGSFISETKIGWVNSEFIHYKNGYFFYSGRLPNKKFYEDTYPQQYRAIVLEEGERKEEYLPFKYNELLLRTNITSDKNSLYVFENKMRLIERCNYTVYEIDKEASPVYAVDFGKHSIPIDFYSDKNIDYNKLQQIVEGDYCHLSLFLEIDNYIYICYSIPEYNRVLFSSLYSKKENKFINIGPLWINDRDNISMPYIIGTHGNSFIGYHNAYDLNTMIITNKNPLTDKIINLGETIKDSDNPIVCIVKMND